MAGSSEEAQTHSYGRKTEGIDGPHVQLKAGDAHSPKSEGGSVMLFAGHGTSADRYHGGSGGSIELIAGSGDGQNKATDHGGDVQITGGAAEKGNGGDFLMKSGPSTEGNSGDIEIASDNSGRLGYSGYIHLGTGSADREASGGIILQTGDSRKSSGGEIYIAVGAAKEGDTYVGAESNDGGNVTVIAGPSSVESCECLCSCPSVCCWHCALLSSFSCALHPPPPQPLADQ